MREHAVSDGPWVGALLGYIRGEGLRSTSVAAACQFVHARLAAGVVDEPGLNRRVIDSVLQRADEPGELLAYWTATFGRAIPKPVKRGVADAVKRLYTEMSVIKWDGRQGAWWHFGDVVEMVHPREYQSVEQDALYRHVIDVRRGAREPDLTRLPTVRAYHALMAVPREERRAYVLAEGAVERLRSAGMTWEILAGWLGEKFDGAVWEAIAPILPYQATLRSLARMDEAGMPDDAAERVGRRLANPDRVRRSRLFPAEFYGAYKATKSLRWGHWLERAIQASLANVPDLPGRTLVLVDQSPSMYPDYSFSSPQQHEHITNADLARMFGSAIALRAADATLVGYGQESYTVPFTRGGALLRLMEQFRMVNGTDTFGAAADHFAGHDRVVIITDEQHNGRRYVSIDQVVPGTVPVYLWNISGYAVGSIASGTGLRHTFGGLTDTAFRTMAQLESGRSGAWPWLEISTAG